MDIGTPRTLKIFAVTFLYACVCVEIAVVFFADTDQARGRETKAKTRGDRVEEERREHVIAAVLCQTAACVCEKIFGLEIES